MIHDEIQKFCQELNTVIIRTLDSESDIVNAFWSQTEITGYWLNAAKMVHHLIALTGKIKPVKNNAFTEISKSLDTDQTSISPDYLKLCSLVKKSF